MKVPHLVFWVRYFFIGAFPIFQGTFPIFQGAFPIFQGAFPAFQGTFPIFQGTWPATIGRWSRGHRAMVTWSSGGGHVAIGRWSLAFSERRLDLRPRVLVHRPPTSTISHIRRIRSIRVQDSFQVNSPSSIIPEIVARTNRQPASAHSLPAIPSSFPQIKKQKICQS